jgi:hypothetical protein
VEPEGVILSLWSTADLLHAIYVANDLYLKENVDRIFIGNKSVSGRKKYFVLVAGYKDKAAALKGKVEYERKGFMRVNLYTR